MKKYIIDKIIVLLFGLFSIVFLFIYIHGPLFIMVPIMIFIAYVFVKLSKNVAFIPIDCILGAREEYMFFVSCVNRYDNEIFNETYYRELKFIYGGNDKLFLIIPEAISIEESYKSELPPTKTKLKVRYYKLSKLLISWEEFDGERGIRYLWKKKKTYI